MVRITATTLRLRSAVRHWILFVPTSRHAWARTNAVPWATSFAVQITATTLRLKFAVRKRTMVPSAVIWGTIASPTDVARREWRRAAPIGVMIRRPIFAARAKRIARGHAAANLSAASSPTAVITRKLRYAVRVATVPKGIPAVPKSAAPILPSVVKTDSVPRLYRSR